MSAGNKNSRRPGGERDPLTTTDPQRPHPQQQENGLTSGARCAWSRMHSLATTTGFHVEKSQRGKNTTTAKNRLRLLEFYMGFTSEASDLLPNIKQKVTAWGTPCWAGCPSEEAAKHSRRDALSETFTRILTTSQHRPPGLQGPPSPPPPPAGPGLRVPCFLPAISWTAHEVRACQFCCADAGATLRGGSGAPTPSHSSAGPGAL